jgi:hypothetical protein
MMIASVTAVAANRAVQLNLRPIHHSIAQHITTGTMSSGRMGLDPRQCRAAPTSTLTAPLAFTHVPVPSTFTKPGP